MVAGSLDGAGGVVSDATTIFVGIQLVVLGLGAAVGAVVAGPTEVVRLPLLLGVTPEEAPVGAAVLEVEPGELTLVPPVVGITVPVGVPPIEDPGLTAVPEGEGEIGSLIVGPGVTLVPVGPVPVGELIPVPEGIGETVSPVGDGPRVLCVGPTPPEEDGPVIGGSDELGSVPPDPVGVGSGVVELPIPVPPSVLDGGSTPGIEEDGGTTTVVGPVGDATGSLAEEPVGPKVPVGLVGEGSTSLIEGPVGSTLPVGEVGDEMGAVPPVEGSGVPEVAGRISLVGTEVEVAV